MLLAEATRRSLGGLDPVRSRHDWARSAVTVAAGTVLVGGPKSRVTALGSDSAAVGRWAADSGPGCVVSPAAAGDRVERRDR